MSPERDREDRDPATFIKPLARKRLLETRTRYGIATVSAPAGVAIAPQTPCVEGPVH